MTLSERNKGNANEYLEDIFQKTKASNHYKGTRRIHVSHHTCIGYKYKFIKPLSAGWIGYVYLNGRIFFCFCILVNFFIFARVYMGLKRQCTCECAHHFKWCVCVCVCDDWRKSLSVCIHQLRVCVCVFAVFSGWREWIRKMRGIFFMKTTTMSATEKNVKIH